MTDFLEATCIMCKTVHPEDEDCPNFPSSAQPADLDPYITAKAMNLYRPPFRFDCGYIFDADNRMVSDNEGQDSIQRVRGWGRIGGMDDAEELQDAVGEIIALALTEYWTRHKSIGRATKLAHPGSRAISETEK